MATLSLTFYTSPSEMNAGYIKMNDEPYIIGKIVKLRDQRQANNFHRKQTERQKEKVDEFNIFIMHEGFDQEPSMDIPPKWIQLVLKDMCQWYLENKIHGQPGVMRSYKTMA